MNDLISRRAAIDKLEHKALEPDYYHKGEDWYDGMNSAVFELYDVPSADRPTGKWIDMSNGGAIRTPWWESGKCDQCGKYGSKAWDYCPHCGSRNREE